LSVRTALAKIAEELEKLFDKNCIEQITYKSWTLTDRSLLETHVDPSDEFLQKFIDYLKRLLKHNFIAKSQSKFLSDCKAFCESGVFIVLCDFAENYSFVVQDAVQSFHWCNDQATIHPFVVYHKENDKLLVDSFVVISESLHHDATAVHLYIKKLIHDLQNKYSDIQKIMYFTDGAASQYKNKSNFLNLAYHLDDFGIDAEWHFFATSHGKSPCDGVGETVKRLAARASLQRPHDNQIMTPRALYDWATIAMPKINFFFYNTQEYESHLENLRHRLSKAQTIPGTRGFHSFIPISNNEIRCKVVSTSDESKLFKIQKTQEKLNLKSFYFLFDCVLRCIQVVSLRCITKYGDVQRNLHPFFIFF